MVVPFGVLQRSGTTCLNSSKKLLKWTAGAPLIHVALGSHGSTSVAT